MAPGFLERADDMMDDLGIGYWRGFTLISGTFTIIGTSLKIAGFFDWLSYRFIATIVIVVFIFEIGVRVGQYQPDGNHVLIKGCIDRNGACWMGELKTEKDGSLVDVVDTPYCTECGSKLIKRNDNTISMESYWDCSECRSVIPSSEQSAVAEQFEHHFERIANVDDLYNIDTESIKGLEKTKNPTNIWASYIESLDDDELSICCIDWSLNQTY